MNKEFSKRNLKRCESPTGFDHKLNSWSTSDWMVALVGEIGEAANNLKKLNRIRDGVKTKEKKEHLEQEFAKELGDAYVYLDLLCQSKDIDLESVVNHVFEAKSLEIGYKEEE